MTKFQKVVNFVVSRKVFTRKQFDAKFGTYPNSASTYLNILNNADYVSNPLRGAWVRTQPKSAFKNLTIKKALGNSLVDMHPDAVEYRRKKRLGKLG